MGISWRGTVGALDCVKAPNGKYNGLNFVIVTVTWRVFVCGHGWSKFKYAVLEMYLDLMF